MHLLTQKMLHIYSLKKRERFTFCKVYTCDAALISVAFIIWSNFTFITFSYKPHCSLTTAKSGASGNYTLLHLDLKKVLQRRFMPLDCPALSLPRLDTTLSFQSFIRYAKRCVNTVGLDLLDTSKGLGSLRRISFNRVVQAALHSIANFKLSPLLLSLLLCLMSR